jgi:hypothetical protein
MSVSFAVFFLLRSRYAVNGLPSVGGEARPVASGSRAVGSGTWPAAPTHLTGLFLTGLGGACASWWRSHGLRILCGSWRSGRRTRAGRRRSEPPTRGGACAQPTWAEAGVDPTGAGQELARQSRTGARAGQSWARASGPRRSSVRGARGGRVGCAGLGRRGGRGSSPAAVECVVLASHDGEERGDGEKLERRGTIV